MSQKQYHVGIVGFGGMAGWHNELIQKIDGLSVAGVYDIKKRDVNMQNPLDFMHMAAWKNYYPMKTWILY